MRFLLVALLTFLAITTADARVRIDLTNPSFKPFPVALPLLSAATPEEKELTRKISKVITNNMTNSTVFDVVDPNAYLQTPESLALTGPLFNEWRLIHADAVLSGTLKLIVVGGVEKIQVEYRLYDTQAERQLVGRRYTVDKKFWRYVGHRISDDIYQTMTGEGGYFATRIVHIGEEADAKGDIVKKLCVMDQDSANHQCLTDGSHLVLTPRFNPEVQKIIYMSYASGKPRLYLLDLPTGKQTIIGDFEGLNSAPRFTPNGKGVAMTLTRGHAGNSEIYTMNLKTRRLKRLTYHRAIDTSPSFEPSGKRIVFNSNRGGRPALYIMDKSGKNVKRLTYGEGNYYAPVWSPRGDMIAFVKELDGTFHIGVIDVNGEEERLLTDSFMDESPSWSPNGRVIVFSRQNPDKNTNTIWSVDLTGYNLRQLPTPSDASDPAWSPLIR